MSDALPLTLKINGETHQIFAKPWHTLLHVVRDVLMLTGSKRGCNQGVCGACTMLIDGQPVRGCLSLAANCTDRDITTIEGIAQNGQLSPVQQALFDNGAVQCGFCTPGMVMAATAIFQRNAKPSLEDIREGISGNLCRCSGYTKIVEALVSVSGGARS